MRRTFALLGAGALLGAVAVYLTMVGDGSTRAAPVVEGDAAGATPAEVGAPALRSIDFLTLALKPVSMTDRAALFRLAADADRRTLEALLTQVAALPDLEGQRLALEALLTRYAEIDGPAALTFARGLSLPSAALAPLFTSWARNDARGALRALGQLDAQSAATLGVALLEVLGRDDLGIARVLGAAPQIDADRFRVEAAIAKAHDDPAAALEDILALPASKAGAAFERLAVIWIERDVYGAIGAAEEIADDSLRNELKAAVVRAWARVDPEALVAYVNDLAPERRNDTLRSPGVLQAFAVVDPQLALQAAENMPGELGLMMKRAALMSLVRDDPLAALNMAEALPAGNERDQMLSAIGSSYGRTNPEAALAWAQGLSPPAPNVIANVLAGLARVDPDRAIDLLFETMAASERSSGPLMALVTNGALDAEHTAKVADRLLASGSRGRELQMLTQRWAQREPHDAMRWLLARGSDAPRAALGQAAIQLGRTDPPAAIAYVDRVPPELRATWISAVADGYAQNDARAAASWIAQHRGAPGYDAALAAIASRTAQTDPSAAARLFDSVNVSDAPDAPQAARRIAAAWARQDHRGAAAWVNAIADDGARTAAIGAVASEWAARDALGARGWALGLPSGAARDTALTQLLGATTTGAIDHVLLDAFSGADARERAVSAAVRMIAPRDAAAARQLADQYLTDAGARRAAERFIEQDRYGPAIGPTPPRLPPAR